MDLSKIYPERPSDVHKGNYGSLMVICGSKLYSGSATFASVSALRAGCDLVTLCSPQRSADIAANNLPDLMTLPLKGEKLVSKHVTSILDTAHVRRINSVVMGSGLDRNVSTFSAIYKLISKFNVPMVLDADALRAIAQRPNVVSNKHVILTPHLGELAILLNQSEVPSDFDVKLVAAKQAAQKYNAVVLLKGNVDIITDGQTTITNNSGVSFMTKGGFGDTLAGIVGALLARGVGLIESAHIGAYINGRAGEMAARGRGDGLVASDIFDFIPKVISS